MSLTLPDVPIAAKGLDALVALGLIITIEPFDKAEALVLVTTDAGDEISVWASPSTPEYRSVWQAAHSAGYVATVSEWGANVDMDHVYPKSWARQVGAKYVRLFPVWAEVNRSAGGGREKSALQSGSIPNDWKNGILYANELQVLKMIGHPVGGSAKPESIFDNKRRKR